MRKFFYILLLLFVSALAQAQMNCTFTHYSQENGLSENSVMDMVQDHDGMIWFATWDESIASMATTLRFIRPVRKTICDGVPIV